MLRFIPEQGRYRRSRHLAPARCANVCQPIIEGTLDDFSDDELRLIRNNSDTPEIIPVKNIKKVEVTWLDIFVSYEDTMAEWNGVAWQDQTPEVVAHKHIVFRHPELGWAVEEEQN